MHKFWDEKAMAASPHKGFSHILIWLLTLIPAVVSAFLATYSILITYQPQPLQLNSPGNTAFDIPIEIPLEEGNPMTGTENAYLQSEARKQAIEHGRQTGQSSSTTGNYWEYPSTILPCTKSGDDLLVLVNKSYQLPATYSPSDLVPIENSGIRTTRSSLTVRTIIISSLSDLNTSAQAQGIDLAILSAYRSYDTQQTTYSYWVSYNGGSIDAADRVSARPGHSQHQLGTAVDFTTSEISDQLGQQFADTAAGRWLAEHAWEYGFALAYPLGAESITGYSYEPWHFRYIGIENAAEWHGSGDTLEGWLRREN
jgi:LAS superfamily LD-carboxypeptidase LdcB